MNPAPTLAMLWEAVDPGEALRTRFGFDHPADAARWVDATVRGQWGVDVDTCDRIVMSGENAMAWIRTSRGRMVLKWSVASAKFARLEALARLTAWVGGQGLPVSTPVPARDGGLQVVVDGASLGLQHEIDDDLLDTGDLDQVREAGATLSRLHDALATYPGTPQIPGLSTPYAPLARQVTEWLDARPDHPAGPALDTLRRLVAEAGSDDLPVQLVHGDYRSANVFVDGARVTAVIDFEEARIDHRIVELARTVVLLGTRFHDWGPVSPKVHAALLDGYTADRPLTDVESRWWRPLVLWSTLAMVPPGDDPTGWAASALALSRGW